MKTDTEGIVLREVKTAYNRRMLLLFTKEYGKISAGTSLGERGRSKTSLALQRFTSGRYSLHTGRNGYNIDSAEVIRSHYGIGEDIDKYICGSYVLEFTDKILEDGVPMPAVYNLIMEFFEILEKRERGFGTLVLAYQMKLFGYLGVSPELKRCTRCGKQIYRPSTPVEKEEGDNQTGNDGFWLSIADGGLVCTECMDEKARSEMEETASDSLIYSSNFDILEALIYFKSNHLKRLEKIALNEKNGRLIQKFIRGYAAYHLDASNIKSEKML